MFISLEKDIQNKTKGQKILEIITYYATSILLAFALIYFENTGYGFGLSIWIVGVFIIVISIAAGTKGISDLRKERLSLFERNKLEANQRHSKIEKRKKSQRKTFKKHNTMQEEYLWALMESRFQMVLIVIIVCIVFFSSFCHILWIEYEFHIIHVLFILVAVGFAMIMNYVSIKHIVKRFEYMITNSGYDLHEVNFDYMHGVGCVAMSGYLNIGYQYSVYCSMKKECFIIPNHDIIGIEKRMYTEAVEGIEGRFNRFCIRIYTDNYWKEFLTDDIGADVVLQEYEKHGVKIRSLDMR